MTTRSVTGSCFCGAVTFELDLPTAFCAHCHCSMCRRPHGASYVTWTGVPPEQFRITAGGDELGTYRSSEHGRRQFCRRCGSQLFCWHEGEGNAPPRLIDIALAALHGDIDRRPDRHYYYDSRAKWTDVNDDLLKLGGETGREPLVES